MLETMPPIARLQWAEAHDGVHVDVLVKAIHIGERVVKNVVLDFPDCGIATHQIEDAADPQVDPLLVAVRIMICVVHYIHSNACKSEPHDDLRHPEHPPVAQESPSQENPRDKVQADHHSGFEMQPPIAFSAQVALGKVGVYTSPKGAREL